MIFVYDAIQVVRLEVAQERRSQTQGRWAAILTARDGDEEAIIPTATGPQGGWGEVHMEGSHGGVGRRTPASGCSFCFRVIICF